MKKKYLNFTAKEILPSLLDKTKVQTMRKAWKIELGKLGALPNGHTSTVARMEEKPAKFKVGDKVELYWDKDNESEWFCRKCGESHIDCLKTCSNYGKTYEGHISEHTHLVFCKNLGTVEITEVFKIKINSVIAMDKNRFFFLDVVDGEDNIGKYNTGELAKKDGFESVNDMFNYLDKQYDLSQPRELWVYRWRYL